MNTAGQLWYRHLFSPPMLLPVRSLTLLSLAAPFLAFSQATTPLVKDDPPPKLDVVEEQVKSLAEVREAGRIRFLKDAYAKIVSVLNQSGAAGDFVIDCMRTVRFRGQENGNVDFAEWKKANRNLYSDRNFQKAAELHLQYLALTLERATLDSSEPLQKKLWAHLGRLVNAVDLHRNIDKPDQRVKFRMVNEQREVTGEIVGDMNAMGEAQVQNGASPEEIKRYVDDMLTGSVDSGLVAQALGLQGHFKEPENWSMVPGDVGAILEQNIRPYLREKKDPALVWTWDYEIKYRMEVLKKKNSDKEIEEFRKEELPRLLWKQAQDWKEVGAPNKALTAELKIAQDYPTHRDFERWMNEIEQDIASLKEKTGEGAAAESDEAAMPPGTATDAPAVNPSST